MQTKDGKTKTYDYDNKQFAKVEIRSKQMNGATVIVEYKMVVTNNGELAGKAAQIVDKLPDGMTFKSELNSDWYEKDGSLYTNSLSGQNIQAGESKEVTLVLTKTMNANNVDYRICLDDLYTYIFFHLSHMLLYQSHYD